VQPASGATGQVAAASGMVKIPSLTVHASDVSMTLPAGAAGANPVTLRGKASESTIEGTHDGLRWRAVRTGT
jgi:hypothetical protein